MSVYPFGIKPEGSKFADKIQRIDNLFRRAVQLLFIIIHKHIKIAELMVRRKLDRFPALAFVQLPVADNDKGAVSAS